MPVRNDAELIDETLNGRPEAFEELVRRYQNRIFTLLFRVCRNRQDAEDLAQETFIKVHDSLAEFEGKASFYTWLYRVAVNTYCSFRRHAKRRRAIRTVPLQAGEVEGEKTNLLPPAPVLDPSEILQNQETQAAIEAAIDSLDEDDKMVVILRHIDRLEYHQIAEILDMPIGTVKSRLSRSRSELRGKLGHLLD